jgi:hypothetical protein
MLVKRVLTGIKSRTRRIKIGGSTEFKKQWRGGCEREEREIKKSKKKN